MFKKWSLLTRLLAIYALIVFLVIPLSYVGFYKYYQSLAYRTLSESFRWEVTSLAERLDNAIAAADGLAVNTLANPSIENWMKETPDANTNNKVINVFNKMRLDLEIEPDSFNRISIIKENGTFLTFGSSYNREQVRKSIAGLSWFGELQAKPVLVVPPHRDDWDSKGKMVVSVIRSAVPGTIIEVQIPYSYLEAMLSQGTPNTTSKQVILYGDNNEILYPASPPQPASANEVTAENKLLHSGWRLVVTQPMDMLLTSVRKTGYWMAAIAGGLSLISLVLFFIFTSRTTRPLVQLSQAMARIPGDARTNEQLEKRFAGLDTKGTQNEIVHLYHAFTSMLQRMEESKRQAVEAHSRELQAQFIALQAQMNPHFLYNTLTLIGMLGMEEGNEEIPKITNGLVRMLRYVTYDSGELVFLQEEVDHTLHYIEIMKTRYREHLVVDVKLEGDLSSVRVPKLSVQPFVENCMKHGFVGKKYPWRIELRVSVKRAGWEVRVQDDGDGFRADYLEEFSRKRERVGRLGLHADEGGLGMLNTYNRLLHTFGDKLRFELSNNKAGGASVYMGCEGEQTDVQNIAG
ncbi:sensor histidine kinase [Paenibacillus sp. HJGM_3]|uniref:sensor histidine kinase n=1 Tax=Paenibacillus sp. HJGM_3 TaxID=3379816 RepID=UPI00385E9929